MKGMSEMVEAEDNKTSWMGMLNDICWSRRFWNQGLGDVRVRGLGHLTSSLWPAGSGVGRALGKSDGQNRVCVPKISVAYRVRCSNS